MLSKIFACVSSAIGRRCRGDETGRMESGRVGLGLIIGGSIVSVFCDGFLFGCLTNSHDPTATNTVAHAPMIAAMIGSVIVLSWAWVQIALGVRSNDPKLSDRGVRRGTCMAGGKAAVEAGAVTHGAVRCSAWLGDG